MEETDEGSRSMRGRQRKGDEKERKEGWRREKKNKSDFGKPIH